jgi:5'-3' exonuclease
MGIPSYFSYIVKNHIEIVRKFNKTNFPDGVNNLFIDSNSIIYDCINTIDFSINNNNNNNINNNIIQNVISKIEEYIYIISPNKNVVIAFDGVAPVAKLEQQRTRRYKSLYQSEIHKKIFKKNNKITINTSMITPGTLFMNQLNNSINNHFNNNKFNQNIVITDSSIYGEGEHKIFKYIRTNKEHLYDDINVIYGLDADLIMLSINNLPITPKIFLFRETPEFIKSIDNSLEPNEIYFIDIPELTNTISLNMSFPVFEKTTPDGISPSDYIFLCFFLGNDFMPHFPSVNIRTGGIDKLLNAYKSTIGRTNDKLTDGKQIFWKNVRKLVSFLAENEEKYFKEEMKLRNKRDKSNIPINTPEDLFKKFELLPNYEREIEKYINPFQNNWNERYYKALFYFDYDEKRVSQVCINYLEGLEWTMKYYTSDCPDWRWHYKYNYPPLFKDLLKYIPYFGNDFIKDKPDNPVTETIQLCYVLPRDSLSLLPKEIHNKLIEKYSHLYPSKFEFVWAFCKYFWESHIELPDIDIEELEGLVKEFD